MARKERRDVDYFPFFIKEGRTLFILEGKYQSKGTGFFTNVLRFLARTPEHYFQMQNDSDMLYFFAGTKCDVESGLDMIEIMITTGKLDKELWLEHKIIASQDFLESIQDAYKRRQNDCITIKEIKERFKVTSDIIADNEYINDINADINPLNSEKTDINPQSKVKESKVKESRLEEIRIILMSGVEFLVTPEMILSYQDTYPKIDVIAELKKCRQWNKDNPKKRKTEKGIQRHVNLWLSGADERKNNGSGTQGGTGPAGGKAQSDGADYPVDAEY